MKKFLFILSFSIASIVSFAQFQFPNDSIANKEVTISLQGKYHGLIYELMQDRGTSDAINYVNQLAKYKKADNSFDTSEVMPITVKYRMIPMVYLLLGSNQERLTATDNAEMKLLLKDQLSQPLDANGVPIYLDLLMVIKSIDDENIRQRELIRQAGIDKIKEIQVN